MTDREKLIELLGFVTYMYFDAHENREAIADYLIKNGVTFATGTNVHSTWISVENGLPELIPCDAGTSYSEVVNVLTSGRKVLTAIWNGNEFIADAEFWEAEGEKVTHWAPMPLPLPLPEPPRNNE